MPAFLSNAGGWLLPARHFCLKGEGLGLAVIPSGFGPSGFGPWEFSRNVRKQAAQAASIEDWQPLVMRNQQQNKRMRGRNNRKSHNPLTRVYESNGPDVKIRGTASHIAEKYLQLARDAQSSGDPVSAENYLQHAEHYFRLIAAAQEQFRQTTPFFRGDGGDGVDDMGDDGDEDQAALPGGGEQPVFGPRDPQPYLPRDAQFFQPREQPSFSGRRASKDHASKDHASKDKDDDSNVERLPSFITGGAAPQNGQNGSQAAHQGYGQNGFEGQGDRFPLHRRRRRHRTTRGDAPGQGEGGDTPRQNGGE